MSRPSWTTRLLAAIVSLLLARSAEAAGSSSAAAWYLTFHGSSVWAESNDVVAYDAAGNELGGVLETGAVNEPTLNELRDVTFGPDGNLWLANSFKNESLVLRFGAQPGADGKLPFLGTFVALDKATNPGMKHPFDLAFDAAGNLYVSSQDTALVTRYFGVGSTVEPPGTPMPLPSGLPPANPKTPYPPGTFVASEQYANPGSGVLKSVRGIAFDADGTLFVADESADQVYSYDGATGAFIAKILSTKGVHLATLGGGTPLATVRRSASSGGPIHLLVEPDGTHLLIGTSSNNSVLRYHFPTGKLETFVSSGSGGLSGPAGMAFASDGDLYVASRKTNRVLRYDGKTGKPKKGAFVKQLKDNPEFILPVGGQGN